MIYTFIAERCSDLPVEQCCRVMKVLSMANSQSSLVAMKGPHPSQCCQVFAGLPCPPLARASFMR